MAVIDVSSFLFRPAPLVLTRWLSQVLIRHNVKVNVVDHRGISPLHIAARQGHLAVIQVNLVVVVVSMCENGWQKLIAHGADLTLRDSHGETALYVATVSKQTAIAKVICADCCKKLMPHR